jgi:hypothetical protein
MSRLSLYRMPERREDGDTEFPDIGERHRSRPQAFVERRKSEKLIGRCTSPSDIAKPTGTGWPWPNRGGRVDGNRLQGASDRPSFMPCSSDANWLC